MAWADSEEAIARSAGHSDPRVRYIVGSNLNTSPELLRVLASDRSAKVRQGVALNLNLTDPDILLLLAGDDEPVIRQNVASHPSLPPVAFFVLWDDPDDFVRGALGGNEQAPVEVLSALATDPCGAVRGQVVLNPATQPAVLTSFVDDPDCFVKLDLPDHPRFGEVAVLLLEERGIPATGLPYEWAIQLLLAEIDFTCDCDFHSTPNFPPAPLPQFQVGTVSQV